jgi:LmbE family N-acetylglucosaminyl deacetylase
MRTRRRWRWTVFFMGAMAAPAVAAEPTRRQTLLAVFAHPDDVGVVGPLLARYGRRGTRVHLLIATDGRYGVRDYAGIPAGDALAKARSEEARCAAETLGIEPPVLLGLPDGIAKTEGSPADAIARLTRLVEEVRRLFSTLRPDVVVTWGPDGMSGHPDHRLVSAAVTQVFQEGQPGWPRNLFYPAFPSDRAAGQPSVPGWPPLPVTDPRYLTVRVPYDEQDLKQARASFACHKSQFLPAEQEALFGLIRHYHAGAVSLRPWQPAVGDDLFAAGQPAQAR